MEKKSETARLTTHTHTVSIFFFEKYSASLLSRRFQFLRSSFFYPALISGPQSGASVEFRRLQVFFPSKKIHFLVAQKTREMAFCSTRRVHKKYRKSLVLAQPRKATPLPILCAPAPLSLGLREGGLARKASIYDRGFLS